MARGPIDKTPADKGPPPPKLTPPEARADMVGHGAAAARVAALLARGQFSNGWLISGPDGVGKATFAFRLARALLSPSAGGDMLEGDEKTASLIAAGAHPDLFVARRQWNEKTKKFATEISVDTIRALTQSLTHTAAMGGWRVAIIDTADELNRNAANALLKALEEPPPRAVVMLLSARPGRLLATIRSRCRRIELRPVPSDLIADFLVREGAASADDAAGLAEASRGRPGFALRLAAAEGVEAMAAARAFLRAAGDGRQPEGLAALSGKAGEAVWPLFRALLMERLTDRVALAAAGQKESAASVPALLEARDSISHLFERGEALNLDRGQVLQGVLRIMRRAARSAS